MTTILPPNQFDSGVIAFPPDEAAAPRVPTPPGAAADFPEPSATERRIEEAPASTPTVTVAAGDAGATNDICQIFIGAEKLFDPDPAAYTNADQVIYDLLLQMDDPHTADLIDMPYGMEGIFDPPPLFIQQQMRA